MGEDIKIKISDFMSVSCIKEEMKSSDEEDIEPLTNQKFSTLLPMKRSVENIEGPLKQSRKYQSMKAYDVRSLIKSDIIGFCQEHGLIARSVECTCGLPMNLTKHSKISDGVVWRCKKNGHRTQSSIRRGSFFERSRLKLYDILWIVYMWVYEYSPYSMLHECDNTHATIIDWCTDCREVCRAILECKNDKIGGNNKLVEIFEQKVSKKKKLNKMDPKKKSNSQWVFCAVEQCSTNSVLIIVDSKNSKSIVKLFDQCILPGTTVFGNVWNAYKELSREDFNYLTLQKCLTFYDTITECDIDTVEKFWEITKRPPGPSPYNKYKFNPQFCEFMYRKSLDFAPDPFFEFLKDLAKVYTPSSKLIKTSSSD